jgi:hypothetical protein
MLHHKSTVTRKSTHPIPDQCPNDSRLCKPKGYIENLQSLLMKCPERCPLEILDYPTAKQHKVLLSQTNAHDEE